MENRRAFFEQLRLKAKNDLKISLQSNEEEKSGQDQEEAKECEKFDIHHKPNLFIQLYREEEVLGEGCLGLVKRVVRLSDQLQFACKIVKTRDDETIHNIIKEFKNCRQLNHQNIIKVYELYIDRECGKIYLVMELTEAKEMFSVIHRIGGYSESLASMIFKQIVSGIKYLHDNQICHRDLKPNNILVSGDGKIVKITDFNISKFGDRKSKKNFAQLKMMTYTGTVAFQAPEIFISGTYDQSVDMWSSGVVLYTMLCGQQPFDEEFMQDLIEKIKLGDYKFHENLFSSISEHAKDLIRRCLQKDPKNRISADEALLHPWITQKQNSSPLILLALKNFKTNRVKLITKFSAYRDMGLVRKKSRINTYSLYGKGKKQVSKHRELKQVNYYLKKNSNAKSTTNQNQLQQVREERRFEVDDDSSASSSDSEAEKKQPHPRTLLKQVNVQSKEGAEVINLDDDDEIQNQQDQIDEQDTGVDFIQNTQDQNQKLLLEQQFELLQQQQSISHAENLPDCGIINENLLSQDKGNQVKRAFTDKQIEFGSKQMDIFNKRREFQSVIIDDRFRLTEEQWLKIQQLEDNMKKQEQEEKSKGLLDNQDVQRNKRKSKTIALIQQLQLMEDNIIESYAKSGSSSSEHSN